MQVALLNNGTTVVSLLDFNGAGNMFSTVRQVGCRNGNHVLGVYQKTLFLES